MAETAEDFLGPRDRYKEPPGATAEEFLGPRQLYEADRLGGGIWDHLFTTDEAPGRLMDRFNKGYKEAFGPDPLGLDRIKIPTTDASGQTVQKSMTQLGREVGLFPGTNDEWVIGLRQFNESLLRGTAALADYALRSLYATARGAAATAGAPGLTAKIVGPAGAAASAVLEGGLMELAIVPEFMHGHELYPRNIETLIDLAHVESPHPTVVSVIEGLNAEQGPRSTANQVVLPSVPEAPDPVQVGRADFQQEIAAKMAEASRLREEGRAYGAVPAEAVRLEAEVRRAQERLDALPERPPAEPVRPQVVEQLDELTQQREQLSGWLRDIVEGPPTSFRIGGVEIPAETPLTQVPQAVGEPVTGIQAGQAAIAERLRRGIDEIDQRINQIMPEVREAAREQGPAITYEIQRPIYADVGLPLEGEVPLPRGVTLRPDGGYDVATTDGTIRADNAADATRISARYETLTQRRPTIAQEVYRDLRAADRPDTEARASAALVQAYYEARAARFEGRLGTARDLYDADAPDIVGAAGRNRGAYSVADRAITLFGNADASTFIHESAHNWFEDLLRDAKQEDAPAGLIEDLNAVRAWLGMEGDRPTRAQHEKFARGFERYMMEGVAPEARLATVFAKFRDWLVKLYQTVSRLKAPITPEIRGVYDRLLSAEKNEAVIAPERELRSSFADVHEADLRITPPEDALAKAEAIRAERDDIATVIRAEINLGRQRARAAARTSRGATEGDTGRTIVPEPTTGAVRPEPGGTGPGAEAAAVGGERVASTVESERVTRPDQLFTDRPETGLVDRAGNIRLDNLNAPEQVEEAIRLSAEYNNGFGRERRGVVSDAHILELATSLGRDASFLDKKAIGEAFNAEEIIAARILLRQSETDIRAAMQEVNQGGDPLKLAQAITRNEMIQGKVSQATAEWGRAGRAFRELSSFANGDALAQFLKDNKGDFGRTYDQLLQMATYGDYLTGPGQINKFVNKTHGAQHSILYYYLNSLLSGPITHSIYAIGNELRATILTPLSATFQAGVGEARAVGARLTGREVPTDRVYFDEVWAALYGLGKGHLEGWRAARDAFKTGVQVTLPGMRGYTGGPLMAPMLEATRGVGTGFKDFVGGVTQGDLQAAGKGLFQLYGLPYRSVASIHSFGATVGYYQNLFRYATRQALSEGLAGDALRTRIAKLSQDPSPELMRQAFNERQEIMPDVPKGIQEWASISQRASEEAMKAMYMRVYDYHSPAATVIRGLHSNPFLAMLVPFVKVGLEIQRENWIRHSPLGYASSEIRPQLLGREGGAAFDEAQGRVMLGISLISGGALLSAMGLMDDLGPADPAEREVWQLTHTPHSLSIGAVKIPLRGIPILGDLLRFGADMYGAAALHWHKPEYSQLAQNYIHAFAHAAFEEGFFRDLADIGSMIHEPGRYAGRWLLNWAPNWMPWSIGMGQVNRFGFDPYSKDIHGFDATAVLDSFRRQIPGASGYVPDRIDLFGNPIKSRASWAAHYQAYVNDPVAQMMDRVHLGIGRLDRTIEGVELTTREYEHFATVAGKLTHQMLTPLANNQGFAKQPEGVQRLQIHNVITMAREQARILMRAESMKNNPRDNIDTKAAAKKLEALK
jgi:hypothetical protein